MKEITQADIEDINGAWNHYQDAAQYPGVASIHAKARYLKLLDKHGPALLEAAEYGIRARMFFREMKEKSFNPNRRMCEGCIVSGFCDDFGLCTDVTNAISEAGLLEGE